MVGVIVSAVIAVSALWVYLDASGRKVGKIAGLRSFWNMSAGAWGTATLLLWIVAFPCYLWKRSELIGLATQHPSESSGRPLKAAIFGALGGLMVFGQVGAGGLPACDSDVVQGLARQIISQQVPGVTLASFAEIPAESSSDRRVCRAQATSAMGTEWLTFTVDPHGEGQIFVQFRP